MLVVLLTTSYRAAAESKTTKPKRVDFTRQIKPILERSCYRCHGPEEPKGELRLDVKAAALKGGHSGKVIIAGKADKSLLVKLISMPEDSLDIMPAKGPLLSTQEIALIRDWIDQGADWPDSTPEKKDPKK